jgi:hypothetical protein
VILASVVVLAVVVVGGGLAGLYLFLNHSGNSPTEDGDGVDLPDEVEPVDGVEAMGDDPQAVRLKQPSYTRMPLGIIKQFWKMRQHYLKEQKLQNKGYVKWFVVRDTWPEPLYVQPEQNADGVPRVYYEGKPYAFPDSGLLPDERQGMLTCIHKHGEADPINVREPADDAIPAQQWHEILNMSLESSPPGLLDRLNIDGQDAVMYALAATIVVAVGWSLVGGGL